MDEIRNGRIIGQKIAQKFNITKEEFLNAFNNNEIKNNSLRFCFEKLMKFYGAQNLIPPTTYKTADEKHRYNVLYNIRTKGSLPDVIILRKHNITADQLTKAFSEYLTSRMQACAKIAVLLADQADQKEYTSSQVQN